MAPRTVHRMTAKKEKWAQEGSEFTTSITRGDASKVCPGGCRLGKWWVTCLRQFDKRRCNFHPFPGFGYHHLEIDLFQQCHDSWIFVNFDGTPHGTGPRGGTFGLLWCGCAAGFSARTGNWSWWFSSFWGVNIWLYQRIPTMTQLAGIGFDHWTLVCYCRHDCRFHKPPIVPDQIFHGAWFTPIIQLRFWTTIFYLVDLLFENTLWLFNIAMENGP